MQIQSDKELNPTTELPETDPVYLAFLDQQAELDRAQTQYERGDIE
jgi:hypothetical protein